MGRPRALWAGLAAGLTVSTLPAVRSMELALMESRLMSACRSSSATMPLYCRGRPSASSW